LLDGNFNVHLTTTTIKTKKNELCIKINEEEKEMNLIKYISLET